MYYCECALKNDKQGRPGNEVRVVKNFVYTAAANIKFWSSQVNKTCLTSSQQPLKSQQGGSILEMHSGYLMGLWERLGQTAWIRKPVCEKSSQSGCGNQAMTPSCMVPPPGDGWWRRWAVQLGETTLSWPGGLLPNIQKENTC